MMKIEFEDLSVLNKSVFNEIIKDASIMKYIHVADNYFEYLFSSKHIQYKLIKVDHHYVGGLHMERIDDYATFSIGVMSRFQRKGIATAVINLLKQNIFNLSIDRYKVFIETMNDSSIVLFTNCGFIQTGFEDEIIEFTYKLSNA